jgi:hypothetical protein
VISSSCAAKWWVAVGGELLERIAAAEVTPLCRAPLDTITWAGIVARGLLQMAPAGFVSVLCRTHRGCERGTEVTRIEGRYQD